MLPDVSIVQRTKICIQVRTVVQGKGGGGGGGGGGVQALIVQDRFVIIAVVVQAQNQMHRALHNDCRKSAFHHRSYQNASGGAGTVHAFQPTLQGISIVEAPHLLGAQHSTRQRPVQVIFIPRILLPS